MEQLIGTNFAWCVGIEDTFIPQTRAGMRALDEYELMDHYRQWKADFDLASDLGVSHIRWGVPWYKVNPDPGKYDWHWIDEVLDYLVNRKHIQPIIDLMHYGTPFWLENSFLNTSYPQRVAEYAHEFSTRYKDLVHFYTPLNEPTVNAEFCGIRGEWPPYMTGKDGYIKLLIPVAKGTVLTAKAIREVDPDAILVQVEAMGKAWSKDERLQNAVKDWCEDRYLGFDLITGNFTEKSHLFNFSQKNGLTEQDLLWFQENNFQPDILGINYYPISGGELIMGKDNQPELIIGLEAGDLNDIVQQSWERYRLPMMLTETGCTEAKIETRKKWMDDTITVVRQNKTAGIPMVGYTWWPLFDMAEWTYRLGTKPLSAYILKGGLWTCHPTQSGNVKRKKNSLSLRYQEYIQGKR